jgi:gamma-glutamyltranspeptidase / glutathione hydrolase
MRIPTTALFLLAFGGCVTAPAVQTPSTAPPDAGRRVVAVHGAVTSANAHASDAGVQMLLAGGNAVDAAVAAAFAIGVVEPHMSGLGGSGAMLIWQQDEQRADYLDFYAAQNVASFRDRNEAPRDGVDMRIVGVPGSVAGLLAAHDRFGRLTRAQVLAPAIRLAEDGYAVGQILAQFIRADSTKLHRFAAARDFLWREGQPLPMGSMIQNPALAAVLRAIAEQGRAGFDGGEAGAAVVAAMNAGGHPVRIDDLRSFTPEWKRPLCATYRGNVVLSAPPPQTGAQVLQALRLLEPHDLAGLGLPTRSADAFDVLVSALRVAQADNRGNDDPRWASVPAAAVLTDAFIAERAPLVAARSASIIPPLDALSFSGTASAACQRYEPWQQVAAVQTRSRPGAALLPAITEQAGADGETTHISVVDAEGNAVALTQTNSTTFGVGALVSGFFLNDSGFRFTDATLQSAAAAWRTRTSTIAPTIVLENGRVRVVTGAPGAGRIPTEIVQTLVYILDYDMDPLHAVRMPRIFPAVGSTTVQLEHGFTPAMLHAARLMGYDPVPQSSSYARLYLIVRQNGRWIGIADPRHDGEARGY